MRSRRLSRLPQGTPLAILAAACVLPCHDAAAQATTALPTVVVTTSRPKRAAQPSTTARVSASPRRTATAARPGGAGPAAGPRTASTPPAAAPGAPSGSAAGTAPGSGPGSLTVPGVEQQRRAIERTAGSVGFVDTENVSNRFTNTLRDLLKEAPGVYVQERFGQEQRISIRGSGNARGFHLRGLELLQDGIPVNLADGSGDLYQLDPLAFRSVEIYKGGNGLAYGTSTLGGAINFISPTAFTAVAPNVLRAEAGSFGTFRLNAQVSRVLGDADFLANQTLTFSDGYREHSQQKASQFNGNVGYRVSEDVETRFFFGAYDVDQKLPGALSLYDALNNPTKANPTALAGDQARVTLTERIANRTSIRFAVGQLDIDTWAIHKYLYHPIFQVLEQDGWTYGIAPRYAADFTIGGWRDQLIVGGRAWAGNNTALQFINVSGSRGAQTLDSRQKAANFDVYAENRFFFLPTVALMTGVKALRSERAYEDKGGLALDPLPKADTRVYGEVNPKIGLLWEAAPRVQVFADLTRSADIPDFTDLTQVTATTTRFVPLRAQNAWTAEVGTRGRLDRLSWDVTLYRSTVRDELLQFSTDFSIPATTFNAPRTIHQGVEFALSAELGRSLFTTGDTIAATQVWTFNDLRFDNDPQYRNNRIAGIPEHVLRTVVTYKHPSGFYVGPNVDWVPRGAFADYANTLRAPGYALLGLQTGVALPNGTLIFAEARNLGDKRFVSDVTTVANANLVSTAIFYPGSGRSIYGGVRATF